MWIKLIEAARYLTTNRKPKLKMRMRSLMALRLGDEYCKRSLLKNRLEGEWIFAPHFEPQAEPSCLVGIERLGRGRLFATRISKPENSNAKS